MPKRKARKKVYKEKRMWGGFTPFQLIVILSVFLIFAIFYLM